MELFYTSSKDVTGMSLHTVMCVILCCLLLVTSSNQSVTGSEGMAMMKDVHFVRLLSVILESGIADTSIVLRSRASICKIIHPI